MGNGGLDDLIERTFEEFGTLCHELAVASETKQLIIAHDAYSRLKELSDGALNEIEASEWQYSDKHAPFVAALRRISDGGQMGLFALDMKDQADQFLQLASDNLHEAYAWFEWTRP